MRTLLRVLFAVLVFAVAGFVLARYGLGSKPAPAPVPLSHRAAAANFSVDFPADWRQIPAAGGGPASAGAVVLVPTQLKDATLRIGMVQEAAPGSLPAPLQAGVTQLSTPQVVVLGGSTFKRYLGVAPRGENATESIYLLPTTGGTITGVCSAQRQVVAFTSTCERVLASLRLTSGAVLSLTADLAYALKLNRILTGFNAARRSAAPGLQSADNKVRAGAASQLAAASGRAAAAVRRITGVPVSVANRSLAVALSAEASAYAALSRASAATDAAGYARAQSEIARADRRLGAAFSELRRIGYHVS